MVTYKQAGVDIDKSNEAKKRIKELVKATFSQNVLTGIGTFGALYSFDKDAYKEPVLVSSADGVGTKLKLAIKSRKYDTIGQDLVNHCVNDILAMGAKPLFFLDYIAMGKMQPDVVAEIVKGLLLACKENHCGLIGGETAEMPGVYNVTANVSDFDLAGFILGVAEKEKIISGKDIKSGDAIIGLASNGLQTNGFSLANKIFFEMNRYKLEDKPDELDSTSIGEALMAVHQSFLKPISALLEAGIEIKGMAHITGGGLIENIPRILPNSTSALLHKNSWEIPAIFGLIKRLGNVPEKDMYRAFNMGVGFAIVVNREDAAKASNILSAADAGNSVIGEIVEGKKKEVLIK